MVLAEAVCAALAERDLAHLPVVIGGIIPTADAEQLKAMGVAAVFTPKDFDLGRILAEVVGIAEQKYLRRNTPSPGIAAE
jgi:(2R)-ethylmalonyl-CoA mutase